MSDYSNLLVEASTKRAHYVVSNLLNGEIYIHTDEGTKYTEEAQKEFNKWYDYYYWFYNKESIEHLEDLIELLNQLIDLE